MARSVSRSTFRHGAAVTGALALLLSACGGGEATVDAGAGAEDDRSIEDIEWESPIADFLGEDTSFDFSSDEAQAEQAEQEREAQEQIVLCMREEGFEYKPEDNSQFMMMEEPTEDGLEWGSRAWTEKFGFGISTMRFSQSEVGPDLVGHNYDDSFEEGDGEYVDPNQEYVDSLSEGEVEAYYAALHGSEPEMPENATDEEMQEAYENWEPDGCYNSAYEDMYGGGWNTFYEEFGEEMDALYERLETDQRVIDYRAEVSACVAGKGFEYTNMEDLYELFENKMSDIGPGNFMGDPLADAGLDYEEMTETEINDFYRDLEKLDDDDRLLLAEVQAEEIELAIAVDDCGGSWIDEDEVLSEVRVEYEERFLEENKDRLAEFEGIAGS